VYPVRNPKVYISLKPIIYVMTVRTISIRDDQQEWLTKNDKSLSKLVQRKIDEEMRRDGSL
jgi:hypothetical protein